MPDSKVSTHESTQTKPTLFDFDTFMCQQLGGNCIFRTKPISVPG